MRKFRPVQIPKHAHPLVRRLFEEMNYQRIGLLDVAKRAGISKNTIVDWKRRSVPQVHNLVACLTVVGLEVEVRCRKED